MSVGKSKLINNFRSFLRRNGFQGSRIKHGTIYIRDGGDSVKIEVVNFDSEPTLNISAWIVENYHFSCYPEDEDVTIKFVEFLKEEIKCTS